MKKVLSVALLSFSFFIFAFSADAQELSKKQIEVFVREDCGHCQDLKVFLNDLSSRRSDFVVIEYDIYTQEAKDFFNQVTEKLQLVKGTPLIYLQNEIIQGFDKTESTGVIITDLLDKKIENPQSLKDYLETHTAEDIRVGSQGVCSEESCEAVSTFTVRVPFIGWTVDPLKYSLPAMAAILGVIDGFNPCAMWVLVMFLTALVAVGDKRKMWQVAGLFIAAEAVMYYLILTVWLYAWDFIGLDRIVTPLVGLIAIGGGLFFLYEWKKSDGTCQVTNLEQKRTISQKIKEFTSKPMNVLTAFGIIGLALSVNVIEFACSIGIPQAYTKILDINNLSWLVKQFYNIIYILGYMIDDFIVFGIALYSFEKIGLTTKYSKASNLIGGILMIILGLLLIFKPSLLVL